MWVRIYQHLLPRARAWQITIDKCLRRVFVGLSGMSEQVQTFFEQVFQTLDPQKTTALEQFESQFALPDSGLTEQERRDRLEARWSFKGGQSPRYLQDSLQAYGFDVYVHEWWEASLRPAGGSVNGDAIPVARNPFLYLNDGTVSGEAMFDGSEEAFDGGELALDGARISGGLGYPLVNKIVVTISNPLGDGSEDMLDGGDLAYDGLKSNELGYKQYIMPQGEQYYPYYLYIGGEVFPELASVPQSRRDEFEELCLKLAPAQQWLGMLIQYT